MSELQKKSGNGWLVAAGVATFLVAGVVGNRLRTGERVEKTATQAVDTAAIDGALRYKIPVSMSQPHLGADDALVTIVEWGGFRGAAEREAADAMAALQKKYGADLRLVHRQLPTPTSEESVHINHFARGAFDVANKFWEVRERLLAAPEGVEITKEAMQSIATEFGIDWNAIEAGLAKENFSRYVVVDIRFAGVFGVDRTPTLFVNGVRLPDVRAGQLEPALEHLVKRELASAKKLVERGVDRAKVYDTVIDDGRWSLKDDPIARRAAQAEKAEGAAASSMAQTPTPAKAAVDGDRKEP